MIHRANHLRALAMLVAALMFWAGAVQASSKPPKPIPLLGSHPSKDAQTARSALLKQRTKSISFQAAPPAKLANSLNHRPGKTITVARKPPK